MLHDESLLCLWHVEYQTWKHLFLFQLKVALVDEAVMVIHINVL